MSSSLPHSPISIKPITAKIIQHILKAINLLCIKGF